MNRIEFMRSYWSYYLVLEGKFISTLNYVELSEDNYKTYSNEYAALIQSIGAELDSFFKVFCGLSKSTTNIKDYATHIIPKYPDILAQEIHVNAYGISFIPFKDWDENQPGKSLAWWTAFTDIKHNRTANMGKASLENVMHILGALCLLEMKYLLLITNGTDEINVPDRESAIFILDKWPRNFISNIGAEVLIDENVHSSN